MNLRLAYMMSWITYHFSSGLDHFIFDEIMMAFIRYALFPKKTTEKLYVRGVIMTLQFLYLLYIMHIDMVYLSVSLNMYQLF